MAEGDYINQEIDQTIRAYTDGSCFANPGYGGWVALVFIDGTERLIAGYEPGITTKDVCELTAAIKALEAPPVSCTATVYRDSKYVVQGMTQWMTNWKRRDWKTYDKKPGANFELWKTLDALNVERSIEWQWVKGHTGHEQNERVDALANGEAEKAAEARRQVKKAEAAATS